MDILVIIGAVVLVLVLGGAFLLFRRPSPKQAVQHSRTPATSGFMALELPQGGACCNAARQIQGQPYAKGMAPTLPLTGCTMTGQCHCRFRLVQEHRVTGDRRTDHDQRTSVRFEPEKKPRRSGFGRRKKENLWKGDH